MTLLDRLERLLSGRRESAFHDFTGSASIAVAHLLRRAGGDTAVPEPSPCPICGRGTAGGHQHVQKDRAGVVPIRKVGG